jgi:anti-sigma B factor antagonist
MTEHIDIQASAGAKPDQRILRLAGSLNLVTVPSFLDAVRAEKAGTLILDFSGVNLVDSAGVGSLIQTYMSFQSSKRKLGFVGMSQRILAVLEITRVRKLLPVFDSLEDAQQKLA